MSETKSNRLSGFVTRYGALLVLGAFLLGTLASAAAVAVEREKRERQLIRVTVYTYTITQADEEIGKETVKCSDYDDNSIFFESTVEMNMTHGAEISTKSQLLLEEDSHFPLELHMSRDVKQATVDFNQTADIEMVSNVAVVNAKTRDVEQTVRLVLPTGTAIVDMNAVFYFYQPLYWYNRELGGVQSFNILDPLTRNQYSASLRYQEDETLTVSGIQLQASRYEYTRENMSAFVFVDEDGRIVKMKQGFMTFNLTDWSDETSSEQ